MDVATISARLGHADNHLEGLRAAFRTRLEQGNLKTEELFEPL